MRISSKVTSNWKINKDWHGVSKVFKILFLIEETSNLINGKLLFIFQRKLHFMTKFLLYFIYSFQKQKLQALSERIDQKQLIQIDDVCRHKRSHHRVQCVWMVGVEVEVGSSTSSNLLCVPPTAPTPSIKLSFHTLWYKQIHFLQMFVFVNVYYHHQHPLQLSIQTLFFSFG